MYFNQVSQARRWGLGKTLFLSLSPCWVNDGWEFSEHETLSFGWISWIRWLNGCLEIVWVYFGWSGNDLISGPGPEISVHRQSGIAPLNYCGFELLRGFITIHGNGRNRGFPAWPEPAAQEPQSSRHRQENHANPHSSCTLRPWGSSCRT